MARNATKHSLFRRGRSSDSMVEIVVDKQEQASIGLEMMNVNNTPDQEEAGGGEEESVCLSTSSSESSLARPEKVPLRQRLRQPVDVEAYMAKRHMTKHQEYWNALTMIPSPLFCMYYVLSGQWVFAAQYDETTAATTNIDNVPDDDNGDTDCWQKSWFHNMPSLPPFSILCVCAAICLHAPFSFIYHWKYSHTLPPKLKSSHWSRRCDQAFIHVASIFIGMATTQNLDYRIANTIYNLDCVRSHFATRTVRPRRNQMRILVSMLLYSIPLLKSHVTEFVELWMVFLISGYFFSQYPVGGWSHAIFHMIMVLGPPIMMTVAVDNSDLSTAVYCKQQQRV